MSTSSALNAARTWLARQARVQHPAGMFDRAGRWTPNAEEHRSCCREIRRPSAAYPYSLMLHCRSRDHIAQMYDVDVDAIQRAIFVLTRWPNDASTILDAVDIEDRLRGTTSSTRRVAAIARRVAAVSQ